MEVAEASCCEARISVVEESTTVICISSFFFPINQNLVLEVICIILLIEVSDIIKIRLQYEASIKPLTNHNLPFT
jgi:hypothetical protein